MHVERIGQFPGSDTLEIAVAHGDAHAVVHIGYPVLIGLNTGQVVDLVAREVVLACARALTGAG